MHHTGVFSRFLRCHNGIDRNRAEFTIREHRGQESLYRRSIEHLKNDRVYSVVPDDRIDVIDQRAYFDKTECSDPA